MKFKEKQDIEKSKMLHKLDYWKLPYETGFDHAVKWALDELSKGDGFKEYWIDKRDMTICDSKRISYGCARNFFPVGKTSEQIHTVDIRALTAANAKLELMNQNCISLGLHESRMQTLDDKLEHLLEVNKELGAENATLKAKLEKCKEQRNYLIDNYYNEENLPDQTEHFDAELAQISAVENKVSEEK
jgi:hypothetical protein